MDLLANLSMGFGQALSFQNVMYCFIGAVYGTILGVLPGIGSIVGISILLPITVHLPPVTAIIMLAGIYYGSAYGGSGHVHPRKHAGRVFLGGHLLRRLPDGQAGKSEGRPGHIRHRLLLCRDPRHRGHHARGPAPRQNRHHVHGGGVLFPASSCHDHGGHPHDRKSHQGPFLRPRRPLARHGGNGTADHPGPVYLRLPPTESKGSISSSLPSGCSPSRRCSRRRSWSRSMGSRSGNKSADGFGSPWRS